MLRIGYVRPTDDGIGADVAALKSLGCHVVRVEDSDAGDQLAVRSLDALAGSSRGLLEVIDRLETRGASLYVLECEISSQGVSGKALRATLEAVARLEPAPPARRRGADDRDIRTPSRAGVGPVEIARRLGVSRMTVWRKLKSLEAATA